MCWLPGLRQGCWASHRNFRLILVLLARAEKSYGDDRTWRALDEGRDLFKGPGFLVVTSIQHVYPVYLCHDVSRDDAPVLRWAIFQDGSNVQDPRTGMCLELDADACGTIPGGVCLANQLPATLLRASEQETHETQKKASRTVRQTLYARPLRLVMHSLMHFMLPTVVRAPRRPHVPSRVNPHEWIKTISRSNTNTPCERPRGIHDASDGHQRWLTAHPPPRLPSSPNVSAEMPK